MKKFLAMFAFAAVLVISAFTLASCSSDDDNNNTSNPLSGTVWKGTLYFEGMPADVTIKFNPVTYEITAGMLKGTGGTYTLSSDYKTVYLSASQGQTIGKISDDGKTMTLSNPTTSATGTLTKQ